MKNMKNINIVVPFVDHITKGKCRNTKGTSSFKMINVKFNKAQHEGVYGRGSNPGVGVRKDLLSAIILYKDLREGWMLRQQRMVGLTT